MTPTNDDELRERFEALRTADRARTPDVQALLGTARASAHLATPSRTPVLIGLAAAAGIVLMIGIALRASHATAPSIEMWQSPTAGFLRTPGDELLRAAPSIESSVLDGAAPSMTPRKGD